MSLKFVHHSGVEYVGIPASAANSGKTIGTVLAWMRCNDLTLSGNDIVGKGDRVSNINPGPLLSLGDTTIGDIAFSLTRNAVANNLFLLSAGATIQQDVWHFIGASYDATGTNIMAQHLYSARLYQPIAEVPSYVSRDPGSGTPDSDSAVDLLFGWVSGTPNHNFGGDIAWVGMWNRQLTLGEIAQVQEASLNNQLACMPGCYVYCWLDNPSVIYDWSGSGNNGTVHSSSVTPPPVAQFTLNKPSVFRLWKAGFQNYVKAGSAETDFQGSGASVYSPAINALYDFARQSFLGGSPVIDWDTDDVKAVLCTDVYSADLAVDQYLSSVPVGTRVATSGNLTGKTVVAGVADASDVTYLAVSGSAVRQIILYKDTGVEATSPLIACLRTVTGLPFTPTGGDVFLQWANGASKIFKL